MSFKDIIQSPPPQFSPAAFWFWYGELKPDVLRKQIDMMAQQGVYNGFMHARAYLKTQYLEEDWWKAVEACIDEGKKVGFYPWLYDEYAWPSGTAGSTFRYGWQKPSRTLEKGVCNMSKYLVSKRYSSFDEYESSEKEYDLVAIFRRDGDSWIHMPEALRAEGEILAFFMEYSPRFVDYLNPETIKEFISCTHEEYKKRFSQHFGSTVPGIFFDEIFMIRQTPWTYRFADEFKKRCGYDIIPMLYALSEPGGEKERKVRNDYYTVVSQLYEETFFVQIADWCKQNRLELTGHIEEHYINHPGRQGQFFNNLRHLDIPGADCHDYRYRFPRKITYREPKFSVSTARAYGKKRAMSEAFGGAGWGCSLQQYKRGVNTLGAMGISMITLHGFYSECDCQGTQADWPCSFFFQNPYWRYFKYFADYMNRICYMNAQGTPVVDVGIYYAIDEMQMEMVAAAPTAAAGRLNKAWNNAIGAMVENQIDADIIDEVSILNSDVSDGRIRVGNQAFRVLVCPDVMQASAELESKLEQFRNNGGKVVYYACNKAHDDGVVATDELYDVICGYFQPDVKVIRGERDNLYVNHRRIEEQEVYFIGNSAPRARSMTLLLREKGSVQRLSPEDGKITDISFTITENGTAVDLWLEQDEACWLIVDSKATSDNFKEAKVVEEIAVAGKWEFLPINSDIEGEEQLKLKSTLLDIPLASFASQLHPDARQIRIKNTAHEEGHCGRHLSLWKASWVTRRLDWTDISMQEKAYFRRTFELDAKPTQARICIAAVNEWKMWINGKAVAESTDARKPSVIDIAQHLTSGENVIAVEVVNHTPMEHFNLLSLDTLPPEEMISLIAQAEITVNGDTLTLCTDEEWLVNDHYFEGWQELSYKPTVHIAHSTNEMMFGGEDARWTQCWERGRPPMLPWGDMPLFGEVISYPQKIYYSILLPAGTQLIYRPDVSGSDICVTVDGIEAVWSNDICTIKPDGLPHQLQISLTANSASDGLHKPVSVSVIPFRWALCDWRLHGLKWYSGFARYRNTLSLAKQEGRYILDMGKVSFQAEVWINGRHAGERIWEPYRLDVTDFIKDGENEFVIIASNSAAVERQFMLVDEGMALGWDRYWNDDNIQREGENLVSGLQGPIQLIHKK